MTIKLKEKKVKQKSLNVQNFLLFYEKSNVFKIKIAKKYVISTQTHFLQSHLFYFTCFENFDVHFLTLQKAAKERFHSKFWQKFVFFKT